MWFVQQRAERIAAFRPEEFWQIELSYSGTSDDGEALTARFSWARHRLFDRLVCLVLYEMCVERGVASVTSITPKETRRRRPTPLATVELQRDASTKLRLASDHTMKRAPPPAFAFATDGPHHHHGCCRSLPLPPLPTAPYRSLVLPPFAHDGLTLFAPNPSFAQLLRSSTSAVTSPTPAPRPTRSRRAST